MSSNFVSIPIGIENDEEMRNDFLNQILFPDEKVHESLENEVKISPWDADYFLYAQ